MRVAWSVIVVGLLFGMSSARVGLRKMGVLKQSPAEVKTIFGSYVQMDEKTMVVCATGYDGFKGAVFVYRHLSGQWKLEQTLTLPNAKGGELFGFQAAVLGDRIVAGATRRKVGGVKSGQAYIFERKQTGKNPWKLTKTLNCAETQPGNNCGYAVAIDSSYVYVNAEQGQVPESAKYGSGAIHIFKTGGSEWQTLRGQKKYDQHGDELKLGGKWLAAGAPYADAGKVLDTGAAYIYRLKGNGKRVLEAKLTAPNAQRSFRFGTTIGMSAGGKVVIVGGDRATGTKKNAVARTGAAFVYKRGKNGWYFSQSLAPDGLKDLDRFGYKISVRPELLVISAWGDDAESGAFYVFRKANNKKWVVNKKIVLNKGKPGDRFGTAMEMNDKWLAVSAPEKSSVSGDPDRADGLVYLYRLVSN